MDHDYTGKDDDLCGASLHFNQCSLKIRLYPKGETPWRLDYTQGIENQTGGTYLWLASGAI